MRSNIIAKRLIQLNPKSEIDVKQKRGRWSEARAYILKQDNTKIDGRLPVEKGNIPRDYTKKEEAIREGGLKKALEEKVDKIIKYPSGCKLVKELIGKKSEKRTVILI